MSTVLVVDDSPIDRRVVGGLLEKNPYLKVNYACSGEEALETLARATPDLVVTDLVMEQIDGLQLVAAVRSKYPLVPVILMTSQGSEEIALKALEAGASSYVPKRLLGQDLLETVNRVLSVSDRRRGSELVMGSMTRSDCAFVLANDPGLIPPLISYLQDDIMHLGLCDETERIRIGVALEEALVNALYHGNLEVSSQLYEDDYRAYRELVDQRFNQSPYKERRIFVDVQINRAQAVFVVRDEGPGFDSHSLPDPTDAANLDKARGRGVLLMRTFMDEVAYNESGNEVTLIKRRDAEAVEMLLAEDS